MPETSSEKSLTRRLLVLNLRVRGQRSRGRRKEHSRRGSRMAEPGTVVVQSSHLASQEALLTGDGKMKGTEADSHEPIAADLTRRECLKTAAAAGVALMMPTIVPAS